MSCLDRPGDQRLKDVSPYPWPGSTQEDGGVTGDLDWQERAACKGKHPDPWFPTSEKDAGPALTICRSCPVRQQCLDYVMTSPGHWTHWGIYGGTTPHDRTRLRKQRRLNLGRAETFARNTRTTPKAAS
jgi:WhiB family redox-sensing transcriptional regulator